MKGDKWWWLWEATTVPSLHNSDEGIAHPMLSVSAWIDQRPESVGGWLVVCIACRMMVSDFPGVGRQSQAWVV